MHRSIYRVQNIPEAYNCEQFEESLLKAVGLEKKALLRCRSFANDASRPRHILTKTAIVSFETSLSILDKERCKLSDGQSTFYCDNVFDGFTPVSPLETASQQIIDCFVIPGWGGHPIGSFMAEGSPYVWLLDGMARDFPQFRVWTYGYSPLLHDQTSGQDVLEFADTFVRLLRRLRRGAARQQEKKPIIFLAHSLGGLLFKEAIVRMNRSSDEDDRANLKSIFGALFFGVPSLGMDVEALAAMVADSPARTTLHDLDRRIGHRVRLRLHDDFCDAFDFKDSAIARFYELEESPTVETDASSPKGWSRSGAPKILVDFESATKARTWDNNVNLICGLQGNHRTMVKLPDYPNPSYDKICDVLDRFSELAPIVIASRFVSTPPERMGMEDSLSEGSTRGDVVEHMSAGIAQERAELLDSLTNEGENSRQQRVVQNLEGTCQWLVCKDEFIAWKCAPQRADSKVILWIKGKPGSGKSTLMKFLIHETIKEHPEAIVLNFFFDARGSDIERTLTGLFRSLLRQIFEQNSSMLDECLLRYRQKRSKGSYQWSEDDLTKSLRTAVLSVKNRLIYIHVDALDECEEEDVNEHKNARRMIQFFEDLLIACQRMSVHMFFVLSSRHYPHITIRRTIRTLEIAMESENFTDIRKYATSQLGSERSEQSFAERDLLDQVAQRSNGIFLWAVLVARELKTAQDRGLATRHLKRILEDLPPELNALFARIMQHIDDEHHDETVKLFRWVLFAQTPLDWESLKMALAFDARHPPQSFESWEGSDYFVDEENFARRVLDLSRGLIEFRGFVGRRHAYFIHETARKFFSLQGRLTFGTETQLDSDTYTRKNHYAMAETCLNFFDTAEMKSRPVVDAFASNLPDTPIPLLDDEGGVSYHFYDSALLDSGSRKRYNLHELNHDLPFWRYAVSNLFFHAHASHARAFQGLFVARLLRTSEDHTLFSVWERFYRLYATVDQGRAAAEYRIWNMVHSMDIRVDKRGLKLQTQSPALEFAFYVALWGLDECLEVALSMTEDMHVRKRAWLAALVAGEKKAFLKADSSTSPHLSIWHCWREAEGDWWRILSSSGPSAFEWKHDRGFISKMSSNLEKLAVGMTLQPPWIIEFIQLQWRRVVTKAGARYDQSLDQTVALFDALQGPRKKSRLDLHPASARGVAATSNPFEGESRY